MAAPRSTKFDDIYFSPEDGPAETKHVFLKGNNLPEAWEKAGSFTIAELGFGTGLNFLLAASLFLETAPEKAHLDYVSIEKYPLDARAIAEALRPFAAQIGPALFDEFLKSYPPLIPGFHRIMIGRVHLTLIFDDVMEALPQLTIPRGVNAWFLDGFAPAKNPAMWDAPVFAEMARLSAPGATCATFTVAGLVRRGLMAAGFSVEKRPGFGRKRQMLGGFYKAAHSGDLLKINPTSAGSPAIAILGAGLAGTSIAWALRARGLSATLYEAGDVLAPGASGNPAGLCNPRLSALRTPQSDIYAAGYARALRLFPQLDPHFNPRGNLHLIHNPEREKKFISCAKNWNWAPAHMRLLDRHEAAHLAGLDLPVGGLLLPDTGLANPALLCRAYAEGSSIHVNQATTPQRCDAGWQIGKASYDILILANGFAAGNLVPLPLEPVRGQITFAQATQKPGLNLCYGGYMGLTHDKRLVIGATFQRGQDDTIPRPEDDQNNLEKLGSLLPDYAAGLTVTGSRAAVRCAARDRFPIAGAVDDQLYISTAHGSHGLVTSLAAASLIADMIAGAPRALSRSSQDALSPGRFARRRRA